MPQTQQQQRDQATPEDVRDFAKNIPENLEQCRGDRHHFDLKAQAVPLTSTGERTTTASRVTQVEYVDVCPSCGLRRHHLYVIRGDDRSDYWYTDRNPDLIAPRGVYSTGVSVRAEIQRNADKQAVTKLLARMGRKAAAKSGKSGKATKSGPTRRKAVA
ncbi:hypothetical protein [Streptomyces sp. CBMA29]|uniref:hypothetical protein n=1 Tax=Streptomyces sp. CBMA29 TaxID=1896314 RepID=UPI00166211D8|nr:hypothetical protein [Streptomyces sp. CBMA29]